MNLQLKDRVRYEGREGRVVLLMGPPDKWALVQIELEPYGPIHGDMVILRGEETERVERL